MAKTPRGPVPIMPWPLGVLSRIAPWPELCCLCFLWAQWRLNQELVRLDDQVQSLIAAIENLEKRLIDMESEKIVVTTVMKNLEKRLNDKESEKIVVTVSKL